MYKAERLSPPSRRIPSNTQEWYALLHGPCASDTLQGPRRTVAFRKSFYNDREEQEEGGAAVPAPSRPSLASPASMAPPVPALLSSSTPKTPTSPCEPTVPTTEQQEHSRRLDATATTTTATRHRDRATERSALPLSQRTQPETPDVLLLERNRATELFRWVKRRAGKVEGIERAAILMGPPGSGKTAAARVFLRAAGFQVVEFGPGSLSTECSLADQVRRVVQRKPLPGTRPPAVLIDDFDGLCAIDRDAESSARRDRTQDSAGGVGRARLGNLVAVIAEAKASSPPIIVCSNDSGSAEVRLVREVCHETWFDAVPRARLAHLAKITAARQGCALDDADAGRLADAASGDIRRLLNGLDLWLRVNRERAGPAISAAPIDKGSDTFLGNFGAVEALLAGRTTPGNRPIDCVTAADIYRSDPLLRRAMVHHNYVRAVTDASGPLADVDVLDRISAIADNFAEADAMDYGIGVSGSAGGETGGAAAWRAGARACASVGWAHGANPAATVLWAWTTRALAPRPDSLDKPDVVFCKPSSSDRAQYGEMRDRIVCASAAMVPTASVAGAREPLVLDFDLARTIFVEFATKTRADHAYESWSEGKRKGVIDGMVWAGVTPESLMRLLTWPCMRQRAHQGAMPPPVPSLSSFAGRRTCRLLEDLKGRRQACAVMGDARAASMVMPSAPHAATTVPTWPKTAPSQHEASLEQDASPLSLEHGQGRKRKRSPGGDHRADHARPFSLSSSSDSPAPPIPSFGRGRGATIPRYRALSPSTLYRPPQSFSSARRSAYAPRGGGGARRGGRGRGRS